MPFKSKKQEKYLWANEPAVAKKWTEEHGPAKAEPKKPPPKKK